MADGAAMIAPETPRCTCLEKEGDDPNCPIHGQATDFAEEADRQAEISFCRNGF